MNPDAVVSAVTAYGLPGAPALPPHALDELTWRALVRAATLDRVTPLLSEAITAGALLATETQVAAASRAHEQAMRVCIMLERALLETAARLEAAGIPFRVLKGPAVARLDYPDPAWRAFGDVDLLVGADAYDDVLALLTRHGGRRRYAQVRPGFDRRFGKGACVIEPDGTQIDVHRTFVAGPFGLTVDLGELFAASDAVVVGGRELRALVREQRFVHACFHAALGDVQPRLVALRDVAQLALATPLDHAAAIDLARGWRADAVVARAVGLAWERLRLPPAPLSVWAAEHRADRFQTRALRAYTGPGRSYASQAAAGLTAVRGGPAKVAYVRALVFADRAHVAGRDGSYSRRVRRAWAAFRASQVTR